MTEKEIIRAEIERRYNEYMAKDSELAAIRADECLGILSYIDSMQEESVSEEIEVSYDAKINEAHRLGREEGILLAKTMFKEPVSEDLEKAIDKYLDNGMALRLDWKQCDITFKASRLINFSNHIAQWQKEQMMKNSLYGEVTYGKSLAIPSLGYFLDEHKLDFGDKVKVIIIKED